ncbi:hypothetical protein A4X13_0g73 [Tilletia indica]|uniref:Mitochondrial carrier protein n=1 Tax=Tilletia indica TaxID=43049 RepID=A0A177TIF6_9BASI|nr:hypothetical protein A4X13_0g73 [Tilletia indica]
MHHGTASAISGASAGLAASIVTCPLDVVKTRLQAQIGPLPFRPPQSTTGAGEVSSLVREARDAAAQAQARSTGGNAGASAAGRIGQNPGAMRTAQAQYLSIPQIMRKIWIEDGFKGFYRGLGPTIFGYLPTWAIYFSVYDACKDTLASTLHLNYGHSEFVNHIVAAMAAGAASTVCTSPLWVVKTRFMLQTSADTNGKRYRHTGDAFVQIWRTEGWRGFYKGLLPSLFGVSHVAVQFPLYEQFKVWARASRRRTLEHERGIISSSSGGGGSGWRPDSVLSNGSAGGVAPRGVSLEEEAALPSSTILVCSSTAKMIASVATYPHEVLRTKLQMQPKGAGATANAGASSTTTTTGGAGSTRSFHTLRGSTAHMGGLPWHELPPSASVRRRGTARHWTLPTSSSAPLSHSAPHSSPSPPHNQHPSSSSTSASPLKVAATRASQALTGLTGAATGNPSERRYTGVIQACRTIAREEGIRGFYRGMTVNLVRTVPNSALTILTYELMMRQLTGSNV